jgi:hypothetical protein
LIDAVVDRAVDRRDAQLLLKPSWPGLDGFSDRLFGNNVDTTYVLDLPDDPVRLRFGGSRHHSTIRRAVNKSARLGVQVRPAEVVAELRTWYRLYLDTMRWHAVPPRPYSFFHNCWDLLRPAGHLRLLLAVSAVAGEDRILAGSMYLMGGRTVFYAFNGRRREELSLRPNDAIHWQAIHDACRQGYRHYDFGGVEDENEGLARFKSKWGAEARRLRRYYAPAPREPEETLLPSSQLRALAHAVWKKLPLKATELLGDWLYRHV